MQIKHMNKVVGHVCIKCSKKREVASRPAGMGWRTAFRQFAHKILEERQKVLEQLRRKPVLGRAM